MAAKNLCKFSLVKKLFCAKNSLRAMSGAICKVDDTSLWGPLLAACLPKTSIKIIIGYNNRKTIKTGCIMNIKPTLILLLLLFSCVLTACDADERASVTAVNTEPLAVSFYYWKTIYDPGPESLARLRELDVNRLYLRFFEVTLNEWNQPVPHATVKFVQQPTLPVAPAIYFDLKVFSRPDLNVEQFAQNLVKRVMDMGAHHKLELVRELHIDCDWTPSTRERFFAFTAALKQELPEDWQLVLTLRLDQVKNFSNTGVPIGADRVVIMAYNMGNLRQSGVHNSILDANVAALYLKSGNPYPLPLDVALPLFEWVVVFNDKDAFVGLLRTVPEAMFDERVCRDEGGNIYTVLRPFDTGEGWQAIPGYRLRLEDSRRKDLLKVAALLAKAAPHSGHLIFFHLDDAIVKNWTAAELEEIAQNCR